MIHGIKVEMIIFRKKKSRIKQNRIGSLKGKCF